MFLSHSPGQHRDEESHPGFLSLCWFEISLPLCIYSLFLSLLFSVDLVILDLSPFFFVFLSDSVCVYYLILPSTLSLSLCFIFSIFVSICLFLFSFFLCFLFFLPHSPPPASAGSKDFSRSGSSKSLSLSLWFWLCLYLILYLNLPFSLSPCLSVSFFLLFTLPVSLREAAKIVPQLIIRPLRGGGR